MEPAPLTAMVLAAGRGTRMRSTRPKPLHELCGRAMLLHVLDSLSGAAPQQTVVVVGHYAEEVAKHVTEQAPSLCAEFVEQRTQRGTGDAVAVGLTAVSDADETDVLVLPGDTPLFRPETLAALVADHRGCDAAATMLTAQPDDPTGYGRVLRRPDGAVVSIVEEVDASVEERAIAEVNAGVYCFKRSLLAPALRRVIPANAQGERYLTDVVGVLTAAGHFVAAHPVPAAEAQGVNTQAQLAAAEAVLRGRINRRWMAEGVRMLDPLSTYIDTDVRLAADVTLHPGTVLAGDTVVAGGAVIGPNSSLTRCRVGAGAVLESVTATDAHIGAGTRLGPYAVLAPGAQVPDGARLGSFTASQGE